MARLRRDKGEKLRSGPKSDKSATATKASASQKSSKSSKPKPDGLREQIQALGGTADDFDLVKDVYGDGPLNGGRAEDDPALSKDVSKFLKGLNIAGEPQEKLKIKAPVAEKPTEKKAKQKQPRKSDVTPVAPAAPAPVAEIPPPAPPAVKGSHKSKFIVQPTSHWYAAAPALGASSNPAQITPAALATLLERASTLHATDSHTYQSSSSPSLTPSTADASFLHKILQSGTLSDRLSALTLLVQSSPVHNVKALETLKAMAERGKGKGGRDESLKALRCVVDWWIGGGAPDRKLRYFRDQPLSHPAVTDEHLVLWYFEDWLKKYFFSVLQILETLSLDPLAYVRTQALTLIFTLLRDKPEQEQNLLRLLVNKLGDTEKTICSRASYHLLHLLQTHPSMKSVIVREIVSLALRPPAPAPSSASVPATNKHIRFTDDAPKQKSKPEPKREGNAHARYYAAITFNQITLTPADREVAVQLINVYFEIFKELLGEDKGDEEAPEDVPEDEGKPGDRKGKGKQDKKDGKGKKGEKKGKAKAREVKGEAGFAEVESVHSKLISAVLTGVNRALPFAKMDAADAGLNKHIDTLFLITHTSTFNISLQALVLIQHICASLTLPPAAPSPSTSSASASKSITDRYFRTLYASLHDPRLASSSKQAMYLNLLFKSLKADPDVVRVHAFVRRFVQVLAAGGGGATEFVAGGLYLLGEIFNTVPGLRAMLNSEPSSSEGETYDPRKRDPQYAHASASPLWELTPLTQHYHPAISLHAAQLLAGEPLTASADLSLNTLSHFLDRFVYKNPKKPRPKGASAMQPAAADAGAGAVKLVKGDVGAAEGMVNDEKWWGKMKEGEVPVDQVFFHRFFSRRSEKEKARAKKADRRKEKGDDSDEDESGPDGEPEGDDDDVDSDAHAGDAEGDEDEDSDLEEAAVWKAMKATMPRDAGDDDLLDASDDSDPIPSDLDYDSDSDDMDADEQDGDDAAEDEDDEDDASDALSLAEDSDNEDLVPLDALERGPEGLIEFDGSDAEGEWTGFADDKKRKRGDEKKERRKKLKALPTFASYEDYAAMIEDGPEDDI